MLKILINGMQIDFDGRISYRMLNPMFNDEMSHSYNIKTINTPHNKDIISQLHLPETGYNQIRYDALIISDAFVFRGAIYFNSVTDKYLDFQFNSQNDFWSLAKVSLTSFYISLAGVQYFPVKNSKLMESFPIAGDGFCGYANGLDENGDPLNDETTAPIPFLRLNDVIKAIFDINNLNLSIIENCLTRNADIEQLYMFNSNVNGYYWHNQYSVIPVYFLVSLANDKYTFTCAYQHGIINNSYVLIVSAHIRPIAAENQFVNKVLIVTVEDEYTISFDVDPAVDYLTGAINDNWAVVVKPFYVTTMSVNGRQHVPEINAGDFLKEVEKLTASRIFIDESEQSCRIMSLKDIIKTNDVVDISEYSGEVTEQTLDKQDGYKLSYEDPSDDEYWSDRIKDITDLLTVKDPVATYSALPLTGNTNNDIRLVQDENAYYRYYEVNFLRAKGWEFYSENFLKLQEASGKFSIQTKFSPVLTENINHIMFMKVEKAGKFMIINEYGRDDFRLFFHRGTYTHKNQYNNLVTYPLITNDVYNNEGDKIPAANLSLRWDGEYGLYNQLYKEYIDLMINKYREETRFINWPHWMLNSFAWWKKYRVNHQNYLVKSIDLEMETDSIKLKNTVLIPC